MWPGDLKAISDRLDNLPTAKGFPAGSRPYVYMEVIDQGILHWMSTIKNSNSFSFTKVESQLLPTSTSILVV